HQSVSGLWTASGQCVWSYSCSRRGCSATTRWATSYSHVPVRVEVLVGVLVTGNELAVSMRAAQFLESMCSTKFDKEVYRWHQSKIEQDGFVPKAFEMSLPAVTSGYTESCRDAQMRAAVANYHSHSSTCFKGNRDKYICRLARPAGVHEQPTCPLIVARERLGDMKAGPSLACAIDDGYSVEKGEAF
ncbi:hypothetical protein JG688_00013471, partial [Phytophthora aleatoria]